MKRQQLTFEFVVLGVSREKAVREELGEGEAGILWSVLHIVPHCGLELLHELWGRCAQLLDHLVPLIDVWSGRSRTKKTRPGCEPVESTTFTEKRDEPPS